MYRKIGILAFFALLMGCFGCDEGKYNDLACDSETYKSSCMDAKYYLKCLPENNLLNLTECPSGTICSDDTGEAVCVGDSNACTDSDRQCSGSTVETCINGQWIKASSSCPYGCENGQCREATEIICNENDTQCNGHIVF